MYHGEFLKDNSLLSVSGAVRYVGAFGTLSKCGICRSLGAIAFCSSECSRGPLIVAPASPRRSADCSSSTDADLQVRPSSPSRAAGDIRVDQFRNMYPEKPLQMPDVHSSFAP
jgi:hypothetical protein